jgi:ergothioneine biosynthesis protein EgtB
METPVENTIEVIQRYKKVRQQSEALCKPLAKEDYVVQPVVDVSPPKWHLAHTTWFFETFLLQKFKSDYEVFDQDYGYIFNSYYESVGDRVLRIDRGNLSRPDVDEVYAYRRYVDEAMENLTNGEFTLNDEFHKVLEIGLQHEQQHQELLITDIKYILGHNPVFPDYFLEKSVWQTNQGRIADLLEIPEGAYQIGHQGQEFCFDNELGLHLVYLQAYKIMDRLVTNNEYLEFVTAGGYNDFRFWLMEGWEWVKASEIQGPLYWHQVNGKWHSYNLRGLEPLDGDAPVTHMSFFEADAYARWRGMRLPSEFEWETACKMHQPQMPDTAKFQEGCQFLPLAAPENNFQFYGDAWEWTGSAYRPYPYFEHEDGALGEYNGKFMVNQMVLRGGSCATPKDHIRSTYRNFFHPHLRWQFTGIRLAIHL